MEAADVVFSGGGTSVACEVGAYAALIQRFDIPAIGGTSAGSIVAACHALGLSPERMLEILCTAFSGDVLDQSIWAWKRFGWYRGDKIHGLLKEHLPGTMGALRCDTRIVVCDLWTGVPLIITRESHPKALVADVVRASMSIPVFFAATRLEEANARLFVDGGVAKNFALDAFDDRPERTIGIRMADDAGAVHPVREGEFGAFAHAMARLFMFSSNNAHVSSKHAANVVTIQSTGDGLDFNIGPVEIRRRYGEGFRAVCSSTL